MERALTIFDTPLLMPITDCGEVALLVVACAPSCPKSLAPQHFAAPATTAQAPKLPALSAVTPELSELIATRDVASVPSPLHTPPIPSEPTQCTASPAMTNVLSAPKASAVIPESPINAVTGSLLSLAEPSPSCPVALRPQHSIPPAVSSTHA